MAILRDIDPLLNSYFEIEFIYHSPDEMEGSKLRASFYSKNDRIRTIEFGWANITLFNFIHLLKSFPGEKYDRHFDHFDEGMQLHWVHESRSDLYILYFQSEGMLLPPLKVSKGMLDYFGKTIEYEMRSIANT